MTLALEINDAGLVLARDGRILAEEPGVAMLDGARVVAGAAAVARARLAPLYAETRHWQDLGTEPYSRTMPAAANRAEVAHAQLEAFVAPHLGAGSEALIAVPPWYTREQLGLLLGVAQEAGLRTVGLVDAALAAVSLEPAPETQLHLELGLHRAVVTVLDHAGLLRRTRFELLPQHGWLGLQQGWLDAIAAGFVRRTRYDPLHQAASEQRLCDGLPGWLAAAARGETVPVVLEAAGAEVAVEFPPQSFADAVAALYAEYARVLQRARPARGALELRLSHRFEGLPGLDEALAGIRDCRITRLPRGAAALGALAHEAALRQDGRALSLVQQLPLAATTAPVAANAPGRVPPDARPTHLVLDGRAYRLGAVALTIGSSVPPGRRALAVEAGPGISRSHCSVTVEDGAWLDDHSTYGTWLNGERVGGRAELRAGDRIRLGTPGVECLLVRAVEDDGAA